MQLLQLIHWLLESKDVELKNYLYSKVKNTELVDEIYKKSIDKNFIKECIDGKYVLEKRG